MECIKITSTVSCRSTPSLRRISCPSRTSSWSTFSTGRSTSKSEMSTKPLIRSRSRSPRRAQRLVKRLRPISQRDSGIRAKKMLRKRSRSPRHVDTDIDDDIVIESNYDNQDLGEKFKIDFDEENFDNTDDDFGIALNRSSSNEVCSEEKTAVDGIARLLEEVRQKRFLLLWHRRCYDFNDYIEFSKSNEKSFTNVFLVLDSDQRTVCTVVIGPQICSCGQPGPCVHLIFVLVFVLGVHEEDVLLRQPRLNNDQVTSLLHKYEQRGLRRWRDQLQDVSLIDQVRRDPDLCVLCLKLTVEKNFDFKQCGFCKAIFHSDCLQTWHSASFELSNNFNENANCPLAQCSRSLLLCSSSLSSLSALSRDALSKDWSRRESSMKHTEQLLLDCSDSSNQQIWDRVFRAVSEMLCQTLRDRVLKVFSAAIKTLRALALRLMDRPELVKSVLKPGMLTVVIRCADNNRRVSDLSTSIMMEMCCQMRHVGPDLVLAVMLEECSRALEWPQALGRLVFFNRALDLNLFHLDNDLLSRLADFALMHLEHSHVNVAKLASRLFFVLNELSKNDVEKQLLLRQAINAAQTGPQTDITRRMVNLASNRSIGNLRNGRKTLTNSNNISNKSQKGLLKGRCNAKYSIKCRKMGTKESKFEESVDEQLAVPPQLALTRRAVANHGFLQVANDPQMATVYREGMEWSRGSVLGAGAFSACFSARDRASGLLMAIKELKNENTHNNISEVSIMAKLSHPNVIRMLGFNLARDGVQLFLEWMAGGSVAKLLDEHGAFAEQVVSSYTMQLLLGLDYLHKKAILHRDIKGGNLLVDGSGTRLRIGDFGAALDLNNNNNNNYENNENLSGNGVFRVNGGLEGTIAFMAPEVLRGECYDESCDIWSTGCCIIEMTTAKPPWDGPTLSNHLALIFKICRSVQPPRLPEHLSPLLRALAQDCLSIRPESRPRAHQLLLHPLFTSSIKERGSKHESSALSIGR